MQSVHLDGADDVRAAGNRIAAAASDMRSAASTLDEALHRHALTGDERVQRIEHAAHMNVRAALAQLAIAGMQAKNAKLAAVGIAAQYEEADFLAVAEKLAKECGI